MWTVIFLIITAVPDDQRSMLNRAVDSLCMKHILWNSKAVSPQQLEWELFESVDALDKVVFCRPPT